ncbi:MAG: TetR/AcrR family transcriptional regulator [Novosphingobium sp.]
MAKPAVKTAKSAKHDRRKVIIREQAVQIFADNGYHGATMQQIADSCGMHKASVYHYYRSKDEILFDILTFADNEISALLAKEEAKDVSDLEKVGLFVSGHVAWYLRHPAIARVAFQEWVALAGEELEIQKDRRHRYGRFLRDKVEQCRAQGLIPSTVNVAVMSNFINGAVAAANMWFNPAGPVSAEAIAEEFGKIAISIVSRKDG